MIRSLLGSTALILLAGCPYLGDQGYTDRVRDVDGDGFIAERFGGPDCRDDDPSVTSCDADGDGFRAAAVGGEDCDDTDANVNPDAEETCNDVDDDCDGLVDNDDEVPTAPTWYRDADDDGHGDPSTPLAWCGDAPPGYVLADDDCDDFDATIAPSADEICDAIDHDCDGDPFLGAIQPPTWLSDVDGDGYGDEDDVLAVQCEAPDPTAVRASAGADCAPEDPDAHPGAPEVPYDGLDQDCDGDDLTDIDGDGFDGGPGGPDCDDTRGSANPLAQEVCNGADDDCDGSADNGFLPDGVTPVLTAFWPDLDGDLRGDDSVEPVLSCVQPANHVNQPGDCDDAVPTTYTGAPEFCNGVDDDCDTFVDEDPLDGVRRYRDRDHDLYGDPDFTVFACLDDLDPAFNWVANDDDCDDTSAQASPVGIETCDGLDNDCNGAIDDGVGNIYYVDSDGDGFGNPAQPVLACSTNNGELSTLDTDCNDADPLTNPGAPDICGDAFRQDCRTDVSPFDCDVDGFEDVAAGGTDCDDAEPTVNPAATEICDAFDNDCDGLVNLDDPSLDVSTVGDWYQDLDQDGFGTNVLVAASACDPVPGASNVQGDCDDGDPTTNPDAVEVCDGVDNDCDTTVDDVALEDRTAWYPDADGDGDGDRFAPVALRQCDDPGPGYVTGNGDCRDNVPQVSSLATEVCDGFDNDCDGLFDDDDDDVLADAWYTDDDGDGYGRTASAVFSCVRPAGTVPDGGDCDDTKEAKNPGAVEVCDALDNDCDGLVDDNDPGVTGNVAWVRDDDGDGYGADTLPSDDPAYVEGDRLLRCAQPIGYVLETPGREDCDDASATVNPGAFEVCDTVDNDCDGATDDDDAGLAFAPTWYPDGDGDGWGDAAGVVTTACMAPAGYVQFPGDCDDGQVAVNPLAPEVCDAGAPLDNDCDGLDETMGDPDAVIPQWWPDADGDGFGDAMVAAVATCDAPDFGGPTPVHVGGDCTDTDPSAFPGAPERCNGEDDDCDGLLDEDAIDAVVHWADDDRDGFGDPQGPTQLSCPGSAPQGFAANDDDCGEGDALAYPGAPERCNGVDDDCDGLLDEEPASGGVTFAYDGDQDGWGDVNVTVVACSDSPPTPTDLWVDPSPQGGRTDCDPTNGTIYPGAPELCDGLDNDCDAGTPVDDGLAQLWYIDSDGDGFGAASDTNPVSSCPAVPGRVPVGTDCDDTVAGVNPSVGVEDCDGLDNDCDGFVDDADPDTPVVGLAPYYLDTDGDGFGIDVGLVYACDRPAAHALVGGDCNDGSAAIRPGGVEVCDPADVDEDCDGFADNLDAGPVAGTVFLAPDVDGDGVGTLFDAVDACPEDGLVPVTNGDDCNDDDDRLTTSSTWREDLDGDGYAAPGGQVLGSGCFPPVTLSSPLANDCDDTDLLVAPYRQITVGPTGDIGDLQSALDFLLCVKNDVILEPGYVVPGAPVTLPPTPVRILGANQPGPRFVAADPGVDAEISGLDIAVPGGSTGLSMSQGNVLLKGVTLTGDGATGMRVDGGSLTLVDVLCDTIGDDGAAGCLEASFATLDVFGLEANNITGTAPAIRVYQVGAGSTLQDVTVRDSSLVDYAMWLDSNPLISLLGLDAERSGGLRIVDFDGPTTTALSRLRIFQVQRSEAGVVLDLTHPASDVVMTSSLVYEVDGPGILDLSGASSLQASYLTIAGTNTALEMEPTRTSIDHAVFWNNGSDTSYAPYPVAGWDHNRFEHAGTADFCGVGADCLDGDNGFVPDFIAYAPQLQSDLQLGIPRVGGNLWNQDPGETDANGTAADLGFSGGPAGWTSSLYLTFDDAIPDVWEETFFGDVPGFTPTMVLPEGDDDGDGLDNEGEYLAGTHPRVADTDADGDLDGDELNRGCDPLDPSSNVASGSCP